MRHLAEKRVLAFRLESILDVQELRRTVVVWPCDGDHIEADWVFEQVVTLEKAQRQPREASLFPFIHGLSRMSNLDGATGLHFHENDRLSIHGNEVKLANTVAVGASDDLVAKSLEISRGGLFASLA